MRLKLDENLSRRAVEVFESAGHDVSTVVAEGLSRASDAEVLAAASGERRVLVTLDLDFANPLRFDPAPTAGIAVLRVPDLPGRSDILRAATVLGEALQRDEIAGHLWVVDQTRVREYRQDDST